MASLSPTVTPTASSVPSESQTQDSNQRYQGNGGPSSNLYLVTFLATLFLLLFVSCAIVLRSYILRRRYQRRLEEAMAAGMLLAPRTQGSKRKRFGAKPKMIDTWLADGGQNWDQMMPLCAQPVFVKRKYRDIVPKSTTMDDPSFLPSSPVNPTDQVSNNNTATPSMESRMRAGIMRALFPSRGRESRSPSRNEEADPSDTELVAPPAGTVATPQSTLTSYKVRVEMLQVSVLISMPSPSRTQKKNDTLDSKISFDERDTEEEDGEQMLPEVVFGVTRVNYKHPKTGASTPSLP